MGKNCLTINSSKSKAIILTLLLKAVFPINIITKLNFSTIAISDYSNYIHILHVIDFKLMFRDHIHKVQNRLSRAVDIISKLINFFYPCI